MRGYPWFTDTKHSAIFMQNFLFLKPFQGFYYQSIKSVLIVLCWILFGYKGKLLVFQTSSGANRFKKTFIGAILISIYKFKLETWNPFIAASIKRNRYPDIDLLLLQALCLIRTTRVVPLIKVCVK